MTQAPSRAIALFGTNEPAPPPQILRAGALTAELDGGNLRHIKLGAVELIRAISFIVRDRNWGTFNPGIDALEVAQTADGFTVRYNALAGDAATGFRYEARITGTAAGRLTFEATGHALADFQTNRTGFVVLHPIVGVAGQPVRIEHVDGRCEDGHFPDRIDPVQPMMNLRALTHEAAPGLSVTCRMEGDVYEMEDQRNWTDASYKTYVRPLALPWPYTLPKGEPLTQSVTLTVHDARTAAQAEPDDEAIAFDTAAGPFPMVGMGLDAADINGAMAQMEPLALLGASHVICHFDPGSGHDATTLEAMANTARHLGAEAWLEVVVQSVDTFADELAELGQVLEQLGRPFTTILVSPAPDLKCTLPGSPWPDAPPPRLLFEAARKAFPGARLGGGMFSYFTEMNRKRPPAVLLDLVSFTTTATLHAGDDHSIMEGLESLPAIAASARAIAAGKPLAVGPSAIGMRMNPYGEAPMENGGNIRQAMNFNDPRQRGLLGAAWMLGFVARLAEGGASAIALGAPVGAFGLVHTAQSWPQPWYDQAGGLFPAYHVMRGLCRLVGRPRLGVRHGDRVEALAASGAGGPELWLANRTGAALQVAIPQGARRLFRLDEDSFVAASRQPDAIDLLCDSFSDTSLELKPYAVARLVY